MFNIYIRKGANQMKKSICFLLVLTVCIAVFAACRPVPPELDEMTPLEIWNTYVVNQEDQPADIYAVECSWGHTSVSSFSIRVLRILR